MANDVVVRFLIKGMPDVERALRSVEQAAAKAGRATTVVSRPRAIDPNQAKREAIALAGAVGAGSLLASQMRPAAQRLRPADRPMRGPAQAAEPRQTKAEKRAAEKAAFEGPPEPPEGYRVRQARKRVEEAKAALAARLNADKEEKKSRDKLAAAEETRKRRAFERDQSDQRARERMRERENSQVLREGRRLEEQEHRRQTRAFEREMRRKERDKERFEQGVGNAVMNVGHGIAAGVGRVLNTTKNVVGMVTNIAGGFSIGDAVSRGAHNSGQLEDLLNAAANTASESAFNRKRHDAADVEPQIQATAVRYGMGREDIQGGLREMVAMSADFETSLKLMPKIAELARSEGASFHDLADAAGNVVFAFKDIKDSGEKAEAVMTVMRGLGGQGKAGNIDMRLQAKQIGGIIAAASRYDATGKTEGGAASEDEAARVKGNVQNILKMGALMQFARGGGGAISSSTARSAVTAFTATFGKNARLGKFQSELGMGPEKIFADKAQTILRSPEEILIDALKASHGSTPKMMAAFGSVVGERSIHTLTNAYVKAEEKKKGSGEAAVRAQFDNMVKETMMKEEDVAEMSAKRLAALDAQMATQKEKFDQAVQNTVIPALLKLVPEIDKLVPLFVSLNATAIPAFANLVKNAADLANAHKGLVDDIAAHPVGSIMAYEIASAGIPAVIKTSMESFGIFSTGLIGAGLALQTFAALDIFKSITKSTEKGKKEGAALAEKLMEGDPEAWKKYKAEQEKDSTWRLIGAGLDYGVQGVNAFMGGPAAILGNLFGDKGAKALGFSGQTTRERSEETMTAHALVNESIIASDKIKDAASAAIEEGIKEGARVALLNVRAFTPPTQDMTPAGPPPPPPAAYTALSQRR